ncbi:MAG: hypothetical protein WBA13_08395 [Microcoleaceae cyanobacterium]
MNSKPFNLENDYFFSSVKDPFREQIETFLRKLIKLLSKYQTCVFLTPVRLEYFSDETFQYSFYFGWLITEDKIHPAKAEIKMIFSPTKKLVESTVKPLNKEAVDTLHVAFENHMISEEVKIRPLYDVKFIL